MSFEINTSTYINKNFDLNILMRYKELGGALITLGSDAHSEEKIAINFHKYAKIIKDIGFNYIYYFNNGQPCPISI